MRKAIWKRILPVTLAVAMLMTSMPENVWAGQPDMVSQNAVREGVPFIENGGEEPLLQAEGSDNTNIFDGTSITLSGITLKATYKDDDNKTQVLELTEDGDFELPYDADINMRLDFVLGTASAIDALTDYIYKLPTSIRVDVEAMHQLSDGEGNSIGTVQIAQDGTLTFHFDTVAIGDSLNTRFYVQFEGGLSESLQEAGKEVDISFPTSGGSFDFSVTTTEPTEDIDNPEPKDVEIYKSGTRIVNEGGANYIEWTVEIAPNGRSTLDGVISDTLAAGLTYVPGSAVLADAYEGTVTENCVGQNLELTLSGVKTYYHARVKFKTTYDSSVFTGTVDNSTSQMIGNTAVFNPDDGTTGAVDDATVTIQPNMLEKSGSSIDSDGNITWTVVLNKENLNLKGATFKDTFGSGLQALSGAGDVTVSPALPSGVSVTTDSTGFQIVFPNDADTTQTYTITYKTRVTDFSQSSYTNQTALTGGTDITYNVSKDASVPGYNLLQKNCTSYNSVTNIFTWEIVVNDSAVTMNDVKVTDTFDPAKMEFVSASEPLGTGSDAAGGTLVFSLGTLTGRKVITVTTRIKNPETYFGTWTEFKNKASMTSSLNATPIEKEAGKWVEVKEPVLLSKSGEFTKNSTSQPLNDGTIRWTVTVNEPQLTVKDMSFEDILPDHMEYVPGSFYIQNMYEWDDSKRVYLDPTIGTDTDTGKPAIFYEFHATDAAVADFMTKQFQIVYLTRVTDRNTGNQNTSYTNKASLSVTYEGDIVVGDDASSTVTGVAGGTINKEYSYKSGNSYVDWTVTVNAARNDMSDIANPKISDQLAEYFDYVSGTLYLVGGDGTETEVSRSNYIVSVVNGKLTVQLPTTDDGKYIGNNCYKFKFRTNFNCLAAELEGKTITNTASFTGTGVEYVKESNSVNNISFSSSSAGAVVRREIRVKKVDVTTGNPLPGAKFELYLGTECIGEAVSGADGYAVFEDLNSITGYTLKLLETQAPDGYRIDGTGETIITDYTEANLRTDENGIKYYEIEISNTGLTTVNTGNIQIKKVNAEGDLLSGAEFGLYSDPSCTDASLLYTRETVDGLATFSNMAVGTYYLKEISSPEGYKVSGSIITVVIAMDAGGVISVKYNGTPANVYGITDERAVGKLVITKQDKDNGALLLDGAKFSIYKDADCTDRVDTQTTSLGMLTFDNLELGRTYYYREVTAPSGYVLDSTIHEIKIGTGTEVTDQVESVTIKNERAVGNIVIKKVDNSAVPKALSGVEFTLYESDGTTPCDFDGDGMPDKVTTDDQGMAVFSDIPFGSYIIKETAGKDGYKINVADTPVTISAVGDQNVTIVNDLMKCDIKIVKYDVSDHNILLSGAQFGLYTSLGVRVATGTTNAQGEVWFYDVAYGDYEIRELKAPEGYNSMGTTSIISKANIQDAANSGSVILREFANQKQNGQITLTKLGEADGGATEALSGAEFTLYDENMLPVTTMTSGAAGEVSFTGLVYGTYYVQETKAPDGYVRDTGVYKVIVDSDTTVTEYVKENGTTEALTVINYKSNAPYISVKIKKTNSETGAPLADATFELYKNGTATGITAVTGSDGIAYFKRVHVENDPEATTYEIREVSAPTGYREDPSAVISLGNRTDINRYADPQINGGANLTDSEILWANNTESNATVENTPMKGKIWITKTGLTSGVLLEGTQFTLYQEDKITPVTGITNPVTTNASGVAAFDNLPCGIYYLRETKAPKGYTLNTTETKVVVVDDSILLFTYKDTPINVSISKRAVGGTEEIAGAVFSVVKASDTTSVIDSWTSGTSAHRIPYNKLEVGETYILREDTAPEGYGYMSDVVFRINDDGSITTAAEKSGQTIIVRDKPVTLAISKEGSDAPGTELSGAILAVYDEGGNEIARFTSGTTAYQLPFGILTAPKTGYHYYTLKEISAPDGYELAEDIAFAVAADGTVSTYTSTGGVITYTEIIGGRLVMTDTKKMATDMYIRKLDAVTGSDVAGAEFAIYKETDLSNPIAAWTSDGRPHKLDTSIFTTTDTYVLIEETAPAGYLAANAIKFQVGSDHKITIVTGNADNLNIDRDTIMVRDQALELKIRKQDSFGMLLNGAQLKISEYDTATNTVGSEVATFITGGTVYTVLPTDLCSDASYILQELDAPDGYIKAADIVFTIDRFGRITRADGVSVYNNTIVMEDEEAGLGIGKLALESQEGLAGSTLQLTTVDDPHFTTQTWTSDGHVKTWDLTDFTPGCTYILTEINAPYGYAYTDPITFTIDATDHQIYIAGERVENRTVHIVDARLTLRVSKRDLFADTEVAGARLVILDKYGNTVAAWTSGTSEWIVDTSRLTAGRGDEYEEYTLRELQAPNGYKKAADITFVIDRDGKIYYVTEDDSHVKHYTPAAGNRLIMYDEPQLSINKLDTSGNPVVGAKLTITAKDDAGFTPISWITTETPRYFADDVFTPGVTYVLTEEEAPKGYAYAKRMEFRVDADGNLSVNGETVENKRLVMLDYPIKVYVNKTDAGNGQSLAGAKLVIKNEGGEIIYSFVSAEQAGLLPQDIFTAPKSGGMNYYTLSELEAPGGYMVAEDIGFAIDDEGKLYVRNEKGEYILSTQAELVMKDQPVNGGTTAYGPKTGDSTPLGRLIALCMAGFIGMCAAFGYYFFRRRRAK